MMPPIAAPLRHWPRAWRPPPLNYCSRPTPAPSASTSMLSLLSSSLLTARPRHFSCFSYSPVHSSSCFPRSFGFRAEGLRLAGNSAVLEDLDEEASDEEEGTPRKSRNQLKREARRAVQWAMDLAEFPPPQIKRIVRVASLEKEVYDALMLVKRLGPDVREGRRRQFNYIGRLLRDVEPDLMDALIQASKDHDNDKFQALSKQDIWIDEDDEEEAEEDTDSEEEYQRYIDTAIRWLDGLIDKDSSITKEVYALHNVEFDRQELGKLVRKVQAINEAEVDEENGGESAALTQAKKPLFRFLGRLAKQTLLAAQSE